MSEILKIEIIKKKEDLEDLDTELTNLENLITQLNLLDSKDLKPELLRKVQAKASFVFLAFDKEDRKEESKRLQRIQRIERQIDHLWSMYRWAHKSPKDDLRGYQRALRSALEKRAKIKAGREVRSTLKTRKLTADEVHTLVVTAVKDLKSFFEGRVSSSRYSNVPQYGLAKDSLEFLEQTFGPDDPVVKGVVWGEYSQTLINDIERHVCDVLQVSIHSPHLYGLKHGESVEKSSHFKFALYLVEKTLTYKPEEITISGRKLLQEFVCLAARIGYKGTVVDRVVDCLLKFEKQHSDKEREDRDVVGSVSLIARIARIRAGLETHRYRPNGFVDPIDGRNMRDAIAFLERYSRRFEGRAEIKGLYTLLLEERFESFKEEGFSSQELMGFFRKSSLNGQRTQRAYGMRGMIEHIGDEEEDA